MASFQLHFQVIMLEDKKTKKKNTKLNVYGQIMLDRKENLQGELKDTGVTDIKMNGRKW